MKIEKSNIYTTNGPSLMVPYKAIIIEYENFEEHDNFAVSTEEKDAIKTILPETIIGKINFENIKNIDNLLIELIRAFINSRDELNLKIELKTNNKNNKLIYLEYLYQTQMTPPINAAFGITSHIKSGLANPQPQLNNFINLVTRNSLLLAPKMTLKNMLNGANNLQIPFYPIDDSSGLFSYGQGKNSIFFNFSSSHSDSHIGGLLQADKTKTNMFLKIMGFPTTEQKTAKSLQNCYEAADILGFPVVIKPLAESQGRGITANIRHHEQIEEAYKVASKNSTDSVIVEKFIEGDVHRTTVANGALAVDGGIACTYPPFVVGNGKNNISELIKIENERRDTPDKDELTTDKIKLDETMMKNLLLIGMNENSIPERSSRINLLHTSNAASGGKVKLVPRKDIHPDNLKMTIDVTRLFKLNCSGIDFITPDISRSWREVGAILEVNSHPGVGETLAEGILQGHFSDKNNGRIDSTLIITNNDKFAEQVTQTRKADGVKVGFADLSISTIDGEVKRTAQDELYNNCRSILLHPDCDKIVVSMTSDKVVESGMPIDYFDQCVIDPDCHNDKDIEEVKEFLQKHVGKITTT